MFRRRGVVIGLLAVWAALLWAFWCRGAFVGDFYFNDDCVYMDAVRQIARGQGITTHTVYPAHIAHFRKIFDFPLPFLMHSMFFPVLYAPIYWLSGFKAGAALLMNGLFFVGSCVTLYELGLLLFNPTVALLAVLLVSVEPILLDTAALINTQPSYTLFLLAATLLLFRYLRAPSTKGLILATAVFVLSQYCRVGSALSFIPFLGAIVLRDLKRAPRNAAIVAAVSVPLFLPWWLFYYRATGSPTYSPYYIAFDYVMGRDVMTGFMLRRFGLREILAHLPALTVGRQLSITKDIYREAFHWMNPITFVAGLFALAGTEAGPLWNKYRWYCLAMSASVLWPGYLTNHVYPIIFLWSLPAAAFLARWLQALADKRHRVLAGAAVAALIAQPLVVNARALYKDIPLGDARSVSTITQGTDLAAVRRPRSYKEAYLADWKALARWTNEQVPPPELLYSNASEMVAWHGDRNVLFVAHNAEETRKSLALYPSKWILLVNEDRRVTNEMDWDAAIRRAAEGVPDFMGYERAADFQGTLVRASLYHLK
jgi:4-amino-4-deoxy-L-arabinose transferase-like glycosyltransferase